MALTTPERLRMIAENNGWIGTQPTTMGSWFCPYVNGQSKDEQTESFLVESLHCAITHDEPLIALRAYGQACFYLGQLGHSGIGAFGGSYSMYSDYLLEARNRCEKELHELRTLKDNQPTDRSWT